VKAAAGKTDFIKHEADFGQIPLVCGFLQVGVERLQDPDLPFVDGFPEKIQRATSESDGPGGA
jgi:hypothetical protein